VLTLTLKLSSDATPAALVFIAKVKKNDIKINQEKYSESAWITEDNYKEYKEIGVDEYNLDHRESSEKKAVPDFYKRIDTVYNVLQTRE